MASVFFYIFIILLTLETLWTIFLVRKNVLWIQERAGTVPEYLKNRVTSKELLSASQYSQAKSNIHLLKTIFSAVLVLLVVSTGMIGTFDSLFASVTPIWYRVSLFFGSLMILQQVLDTPLSLYSTFVIEKRFGFNKTTPAVFLIDELKGLVLSLLIMLPLINCMVWFISNFSLWWFYSWLTISLFSIIMMWLFPTFIAPLFNKFSPLPEGELKNALQNLAQKTGFSFKDVKIMDASKRSSHSNAYFTGFGKVKRVVLFDTLVNSMTTNELVSVLAHELGHFKMRHVLKTLLLSQVLLLCGFFTMGILKDLTWIYTALGLHYNSWSVLLSFGLLLPRITFWFSPLLGQLSRHNEFQADKYAKEMTGTGEHLKSALISLEKENLSSPEPHPFFQKWYNSHPTVGQRATALES